MRNSALNRAKRNPDDEFYTTEDTVKKVIIPFIDLISDKTVFCNCDTQESAFPRVLSKYTPYVIASSADYVTTVDTECDWVITNPPFSKIRNFCETMIFEHDFIIIAPLACLTSYPISEYVEQTWLYAYPIPGGAEFIRPDGSHVRMGNCCVLSTRKINRTCFHPTARYNPRRHPKYWNHEAIFVSTMDDIPADYDGLMAVPVTFLMHMDYDEFEIVQIFSKSAADGATPLGQEFIDHLVTKGKYSAGMRIPGLYVDGEARVPYSRVVIRRHRSA